MAKKLEIDIDRLEWAFDALDDDLVGEFPTQSFLDLSTGKLACPETDEENEDLWADENFLRLEPLEIDGYATMEGFVGSLDAGPTKDRLAAAIRGPKPFRQFKNIVLGGGDLELRHAWNQYEQRIGREAIVEWLNGHGIEPVWGEDIFQRSELPDKRPELIAAVLTFVENVSGLPGIRRISLLGSLATQKPHPKDVDLLVEIGSGTDLGQLAKRSRQLRGKTMQTGESRGADVFLCSADGEYLGRVCGWRECRPGLRQSCEALHCGAVEYLHDDLQNVKLSRELVAEPPIDLWPEVVLRIDSLPDDVRTGLVEKLKH